jgi:hypothetical protein
MTIPELLEGTMLVCFGLAWPLANLRMLRTRRAEGKGLPFTLVILTGYLCGASAKLMVMADGLPLAAVFWLYLVNTLSVGVNLALQWHYARFPLLPAAATAVSSLGPVNENRPGGGRSKPWVTPSI